MAGWTRSMQALIEAFRKLPGVGPRTAERFVFFLLSQPDGVSRELAQALVRVKETIRFCKTCFNLADGEECGICQDPARDRAILCVVEDHRSIRAMEKTGHFKGLYHVLLGALSPLDGIGPKDLKIRELKARVRSGQFSEVILATDSDLEGESTALYTAKELKGASPGLKVTRLGFGIPMGSTVELADQVTLSRALEGRHPA